MKEYIKKLLNKSVEAINWLSTLEKNTILHYSVCAILYVFLFSLFNVWSFSAVAAIWAAILTIGVGAVKEYIIDPMFYGQKPENKDMYENAIGIVIGFVATLPALL